MLSITEPRAVDPCPTSFNMAAHVLSNASLQPDHIALEVLGEEWWSYGQIEEAVLGLGTGLKALGMKPGERLLMRVGNTPWFPIVYLAAIAVGVVPIPTSTQLTVEEITKMCKGVKPALIVREHGITMPECRVPVIELDQLKSFRDFPPANYVFGKPDRPAYIIFTSGSTGKPRAVVHAHRAIWARQMMWGGWYGLKSTDRLMHAGSFNWTYTLGAGLMDPWSIGATALIPPDGTPTTKLPELIAKSRATIFAATPGVFRQMMRTDMPPMPKLRHAISAGESMPYAMKRQWNAAAGTMVFEAYGMSECSTFISGSPMRPAPPHAIGYPQPGRRIAILGDDGPVPVGETGHLGIHNSDPGLFIEYDGQPEETASKFQGEWFLTGDMCHMDDTGAIYYDGRTDDMMNAGGYRVSPIEVEDAMASAEGIRECAAAEVRVKIDATVIALFYVADTDLSEDTLSNHAAEKLARYKSPRLFVRVDALPRNANNKILRRELRGDWERQHGQTGHHR
ncbi:class I adenylate-forming enzyme family protein [Marivivens aquimaris]|uniref:class I adenylate-forming enzyme family protein n=1 Tax=Marivivens aquimaris TaxID=2774876 RepID=UPI00187E57ED|nr:class I adenylate-forming enzyme family protein [Marivivens aquimaris]